ncbi:MAG TPA: SpoIIE family protein phosphatase [Terriglobales bacterium]|nr:SpoIIE family protein phosphatase [Terriglobales bacterium]
MALSYRYLRLRLSEAGLLPTSKVALIAWYLLGLDLLLFVLQKVFGLLKLSYGDSLGGWVSFLSLLVIVLFSILAFRWVKAKALWRLRNRLIVTYVFIGVIPVVMLVALALGSFYLFAGQFATFIVTTGLSAELKSLEATNSAITHQLASQIQRGAGTSTAAIESLRQTDKGWANRQVCVWLDKRLILNSTPAGVILAPPTLAAYLKSPFGDVVRDHDQLFLRALETAPVNGGRLTVLSSEPLDQQMLQDLAANLGEVTLYATGLTLHKVEQSQAKSGVHITDESTPNTTITVRKPEGDYVLDTGKGRPPTFTAGTVPGAAAGVDRQVTFPTTVFVVNWDTGDTSSPAAIIVQTRVSKLYERLFGALGDFAPTVEFVLLFVAIIFGLIEVVALIIAWRLTRTVTGAVAQLYEGTQHVNRGDFRHRIPVRSNDQVATLANSFNSMTASLEKLIEEQKEKQRLENELAIAQEVQAQLFPRESIQLASLEVHGFFRPARTVSGDYYDFLTLDSDRLILAVGDISGKGISAALLMATIHSAVRAYSLQDIPVLHEPAAVGAALGSDVMLASGLRGVDVSPGALLSLLNHQLYESTPPEKYATLFLGIYNGAERKLTYSNGGHLPPIIMSEDGSIRRLECGGTVVGLFDHRSYEEGSVELRRGEIFLAYTDGVTEPENDFGEFGEQRLIDLLRENRELPLPRISEIVTAAVDDWIGANEQPDDVTLVLARAR